MDPQRFEALTTYVAQRRAEAQNPALALALTTRHATCHAAGYGSPALIGAMQVTPDTPFQIGSVSKTFAAVAALQAVEAGRLDLHAPVQAYLPWFEVRSSYAGPLTTHHLLSHSAGFVYSMDVSPDPRGVVWALRDTEVGFAPGAHHYYAEPGYQTLTLILEHVWDRPYAQIVRDGILAPLEMGHSHAAITHDLRPHMPRGYRRLYDDRPPHPSHPLVPAAWLEFSSSDGAIVSTAHDMAKFARMLLNHGRGPNGAVISEESFARMAGEAVPGSDYGYGIYTHSRDGYHQLAHGGDMPGYEAYMSLDMDHGLGVAILAAQPYPAGLWWQVHDHWRALGRGQAPPPFKTSPDPKRVENAADYAGTYRSDEGTMAIVATGEQLAIDLDDDRAILEQRGGDRFATAHPQYDRFLFQFGRAEGAVVEVTHGAAWYANARYDGPEDWAYPAEWDAYAGHYCAHNPWLTNWRVVVRQGALWFIWPWGDEDPLTPLADGSFRLGAEPHSPERVRFDQVVDGEAFRAVLSGCSYYRTFTP